MLSGAAEGIPLRATGSQRRRRDEKARGASGSLGVRSGSRERTGEQLSAGEQRVTKES